MRVLCVAEKPSIARSITQILSGGQFTTRPSPSRYIKNFDFNYPYTNSQYTVTSVTGHLLEHDFDSVYSSWRSCDPFDLFDAPVHPTVKTESQAIARNLTNESRRAQTLMIWTDCDREGENIGAEIMEVCRKSNRTIAVRRARFSAIIAQQIHNAAQHPVNLDMAQANAVEARIILDLRIGAAFTRMQTLALQARFQQLKEVISYGPCQFPTLGFVVSRYNQVKAFRPETFWYIYLSLQQDGEAGETPFTWRRGHIFDPEVAIALYQHVLDRPVARVSKVTQKDTKKWKPLPLTTVDLQKAGSRILKISPKKVLDIAEHLYQQGFLSYPRTETDQYDPQFDFMSLVAKQAVDPAWGQFAAGLQNGRFNPPRRGQKNDKAHPPIHPTAHAGNLAGDEKRVYEYITRRFLASCSKDALGWETTIDVVCGDEQFYASGLMVRERNYLDVFPYDKWSDKELPNFAEGQTFMPSVCELKEGQTSRPTLLTEADLVTLMDKNGIGTDATIAQHIQTIIDRRYVIERMQGATKYLVPSTLGIGLVEGYNEIGFDRSLSRPELRRETERQMVQICEGERTKNDMLVENVEKYKEMYMRTRQEMNRIMTCVGNRLQGNEVDFEADFLDIAPGLPVNAVRGGRGGRAGRARARGGRVGGRGGHNAGGNVSGDDSDQDSDQGGAGRGRGGRGRRATRGGASTSGRGRGAAPRPPPPPPPAPPPAMRQHELQDDEIEAFFGDDLPIPPPSPPRVVSRPPLSSSRSLPASAAPQRAARAPVPALAAPGEVFCDCQVPAVIRTVQRETNNKGRQFYTCSQDGSCGFFQWLDEPRAAPAPPPRSRTMPSASSLNVADLSAEKTCSCEPPARAAFREVIKDGPNKGRHFYTCRKPQGSQCGFFEWADEGEGAQPPPPPPANNDRTCFKCGQPGHWANACPGGGDAGGGRGGSGSRNYNATTRNNSAPTPGTCFKCGEEGHYSNACPGGGAGSGGKTSGLKRKASKSSLRGQSKKPRGRGTGTRGRPRKRSNNADDDMDMGY
ncbi:prokaryotic type I DNA topoisomerase [Trametopsis cervina]|nr:prokaryotic type I DNA topoisomerase [Trametopsis cervina]